MQIQDITVLKADGTTSVTYVATMPSAGDRSPARWYANAASPVQGLRPMFEMQTQPNGQNTVRQARFRFSFPSAYTDPVTGRPRLANTMVFDGVMHLPRAEDTTLWLESFVQCGNLLVSEAIRDAVESGYAPT